MSIVIVKANVSHCHSWSKAFDSVCLERNFLDVIELWNDEEKLSWCMAKFVLKNPFFVAIDNNEVVGWAEVTRKIGVSLKHRGELSIGIIKSHRGLGLGKKLMQTVLEEAQREGFSKVELKVRADNVPAVELYLSYGFEFEGCIKEAIKLDGNTINQLEMGRTLNGTTINRTGTNV